RVDQMSAKSRTISDDRDAVLSHARTVAGDAVANRFRIGHGRVEYRAVLALGNFVTGRGQIEIDANVENIALALFHFFTDLLDVTLDRQRHRAGQHLDDDKDIRRRPRAGLEGIAAFDGADLHRWQHELVGILALIFFFPILDRLGHLASRE